MAEPVGRGCECIYPFEKHYVDLALEQLILDNERTIAGHEKALQDPTLTERQATLLRASLDVYRYVNNDMKVVKQRFADTPVCTIEVGEDRRDSDRRAGG